uniref:Niemann-Pick C2 protein n=1 Tax=Rhipicephalus appendiculatus TaxID=34631 RepID=A0A131Z382_RHIAP
MARHCALLAFCLIALVAPAVRGDLTQVQVEECSSGSTSNVDAVRISHCATLPCTVTLEDTPKVEIDFRAAHDSNTLRVRVLGAIGDMAPQPFPAFKTDACNFMGVSCPVKAGDKYTAKFDLAMSRTFPPVAGKAVFKGQDAAGEFFCFKVPVELKH